MKKLYLLCFIHRWHYAFLYIFHYFLNRNSEVFKKLDIDIQLAKKIDPFIVKINAKFFSSYFNIYFSGRIIYLRKSSSDLQVFDQIFLREEYKEPLEIILRELKLNHEPVIVDAGANNGCSAIYLSRFEGLENSRLIALEPFPETTQLLKKNLTSNLSSFEVVPAALWSNDTSIRFDMNFRDGKEWSIRTIEDPSGPVKAISVQYLFDHFNLQEIDILKIDIEGSEFEVFLNSIENVNCLKKIRAVIMEIHDEAGNRQDIYQLLIENEFEIKKLGELTLFLNKKFMKK
jgi:FkbM family methyltransferase